MPVDGLDLVIDQFAEARVPMRPIATLQGYSLGSCEPLHLVEIERDERDTIFSIVPDDHRLTDVQLGLPHLTSCHTPSRLTR